MGTPIETKLRTQALAFTPLSSLLGGPSSNGFRWYDVRKLPKSPYPCVVVTIVSNPADYTFAGQMATSWTGVQFEIWDTDPVRAASVQAQLEVFLANYNGYGLTGLAANANQIRNRRKTIYADTQPSEVQLITDTRIFDNSTV